MGHPANVDVLNAVPQFSVPLFCFVLGLSDSGLELGSSGLGFLSLDLMLSKALNMMAIDWQMFIKHLLCDIHLLC